MLAFDLFILIKGIGVGFVIAAPVGAVGFLCIERTLNKGKIAGLITGLGASVVDMFYGAIAAFGLIRVSHFLIAHQSIFKGVGALLLLYLGVTYFRKKPQEIQPETKTIIAPKKHEAIGDFFSAVLLTITNPLTIISFAALFAGTDFSNLHRAKNVIVDYGWQQASILTLGVFIGAAICWSLLVFGVAWLDAHIEHFSLRIVNRIAGVALIIFAIAMLVTMR